MSSYVPLKGVFDRGRGGMFSEFFFIRNINIKKFLYLCSLNLM